MIWFNLFIWYSQGVLTLCALREEKYIIWVCLRVWKVYYHNKCIIWCNIKLNIFDGSLIILRTSFNYKHYFLPTYKITFKSMSHVEIFGKFCGIDTPNPSFFLWFPHPYHINFNFFPFFLGFTNHIKWFSKGWQYDINSKKISPYVSPMQFWV